MRTNLYSAARELSQLLVCISLLVVFSVGVIAQESGIIYLEPTDVHGLTEEITRGLESKGCQIPRTKNQFGGMTRGEFAAAGQHDLAVLCKYEDKSEIRLFWGGKSQCEARIETEGQILNTVGKKFILGHHMSDGKSRAPIIDHQAISIHIVGGASTIYYCDKGDWVVLKDENK